MYLLYSTPLVKSCNIWKLIGFHSYFIVIPINESSEFVCSLVELHSQNTSPYNYDFSLPNRLLSMNLYRNNFSKAK